MKVIVSARSQVTFDGDGVGIFVDDEKVGTLRNGETIDLELEEDSKVLSVGTRLYSSKPLHLPARGGAYVVERSPTLTFSFLVAAALACVLWIVGFVLQYVLAVFVTSVVSSLFFHWSWRIRPQTVHNE